MRILKSLLPAIVVASLFSSLSYAVTADRVAGAIDPTNVVVLKNHVSPMARAQFDKGPVDPSRSMTVTMLFLPSAQQGQALDKLLAQQQDSTSPNYHKWLTAAQYGQQFGVSQGDIDKISAWLSGQGFKVKYVAHGMDFLSFEGTAAQMESAFRTEIHSYQTQGKMHFANATAPSIPAALSGIIGGFRGLHNFFPRPMLRQHANYTFSSGGSSFTVIAPGDIATLYDITPLYTAGTDGTGQTVAIAGQSDVYLADLVNFRNAFALPALSGCTLDATQTILQAGTCTAGNLQVVWPTTGGDPGLSPGDLGESDLDLEVMNSVARKAQILFVTSGNGVDDSAGWVIDNQLASVISYSYGLCEAFVLAPNIFAAEPTYKKGASLGISFFAASGDAAAATCDGDDGNYPAIIGPSVSYPASSAYVTAVGGTEFDEGNGTYWKNSSSNGSDGGSAISYIPETAWNDTGVAGALDGTGGGASNCAFGTGITETTDGFEIEACNSPTAGGFPKPSWQTGVTLTDSVRDVPDISFSASNYNDPYVVCAPQSEVSNTNLSTSSCANGINTALLTYNSAFGGTSASTPVAAGMTVLLNQYLGASGLGNMNPQLYKIHGTNPTVFHDILGGNNSTTGGTSDNIVQCLGGQPTYEPLALRCPGTTTSTFGYTAGAGYDAVTGLGSIDVNALFGVWGASRTATSVTLTPSTTNINLGQSVTFTAVVTPSTIVGTVGFYNNGSTTPIGTAIVGNNQSAGTAVLVTTALPGGTNNVTASYLGDSAHETSTSAAAVINVTAPDFTIGLGSATGSVIAGHASSAVTVTITPTNTYNQATTLSCASPPTGVTCAFSPNPVTPDGTHAITSSMTITTLASTGTGAVPLTISATNGGTTTHTSLFTLTVSATDQSFTLAPQNTSYQVSQGLSVTATLTLTATNAFNTPVTYTCIDPAPESACTGPTGATATTSPQFLITTTAATTELRRPFDGGMRIFYAALLPGLMGIVFMAGSRKRSVRGMRLLGLIVVLGFSTLWMASCSGSNGGGNKNAGTPKGSYTLTVNATTGGANPVTATTNINLTVQ